MPPAPNPHPTNRISNRCLSIDLEISLQDNHIHALAGVRPDTGQSITWAERNPEVETANRRLTYFEAGNVVDIKDGLSIEGALAELDNLAEGADFVLGHNIIKFDRHHLQTKYPRLKLLQLPVIDTLWLNPLAFPQNPYHRLVKHYKDASLKRNQRNNPHLDAQLALKVFDNQQQELEKLPKETMAAWHWLTTSPVPYGFDLFFGGLRQLGRPTDIEAQEAIGSALKGLACELQAKQVVAMAAEHGWALAYTIAWLSVSGGNSVMPPWVRHNFPATASLVRCLRDEACKEPSCAWCRQYHEPGAELKRLFGFESFRAQPKEDDSDTARPMQQAIVETAMKNQSVLAILPTGTGKSLCYQIPALSRYHKTGSLTIVVSPLVALMADQVEGLKKYGITSCVAINGLLSMPERSEALEQVRIGDVAILLISPEQLRSVSIRNAIEQREISSWVLDEAHCLSKWGHDFRPDYRYIGRFIKEKAGGDSPPPLLCLTATAKPEVKIEICEYFQKHLGVDLKIFDGGSQRGNLEFEVVQTPETDKHQTIHSLLNNHLPPGKEGGAIVYCSTRRRTELVAKMLQEEGIEADHFHAGLDTEKKKGVQRNFIEGKLRAIAATNAFGMGIDKPDVRLVVHADIPSSLENYMQEAGRAGRDQGLAHCALLYTPEDVERQFGMSARSRLSQREINGVLRALRALNRRDRYSSNVVVSPGEILKEDETENFRRDSNTDDTRVRTAIAWLEEAKLISREENQVRIFPSSLQVNSTDEAKNKLTDHGLKESDRNVLVTIVDTLINASPDEGISTDALMAASGTSSRRITAALNKLEQLGLASNDTAITAFVHYGVANPSSSRLEKAKSRERKLIEMMCQSPTDTDASNKIHLNLRTAAQSIQDAELPNTRPEHITRILEGIAGDGRDETGGGSIEVRKQAAETVTVIFKRKLESLTDMANRRQEAAEVLLGHILKKSAGRRGKNLLVEVTLGELQKSIDGVFQPNGQLPRKTKDSRKLMERALLWMHEQEVIRLNKGLTVFRQAMTINVKPETRKFLAEDFEALQLHYDQSIRQIHVMVEYAERGLDRSAEAVRLALDYFTIGDDEFIRRWLPDRQYEIERQTTAESWQAIVEDLNNPQQRKLVADDRDNTNVLVLAGPGSGKTKVLVHRIAYLIRCKRQDPKSILALAYNRHAAAEIRRRLRELIGNDSLGVMVLTCHALAMRLVGRSFSATTTNKLSKEEMENALKDTMRKATALLRGEETEGEEVEAEEAEEARSRLLAGFRWILVDEYQDIGPETYDLISGLAGRTSSDPDTKLTIFAVGDDDQNIYAFNGSSPQFIRRFEQDYNARTSLLVENYRSSKHIIDSANKVIEPGQSRMKTDHPIQINKQRVKDQPGGVWSNLDLLSKGRVQIMAPTGGVIPQAQAAIAELERLSKLTDDWDWSRCAVIAREWKYLEPIRGICELENIPVQLANEGDLSVWHLRETQLLKREAEQRGLTQLKIKGLKEWLNNQRRGPWINLLSQAIDEFELEIGDTEVPAVEFIEWLAEWCRDTRRNQRGLLLLTAHRAKGLEFDHVVVLDGGWDKRNNREDSDASLRLYYVAMTRAKHTLALTRLNETNLFHGPLKDEGSVRWQPQVDLPQPTPEMERLYRSLTLKDVYLSFAGYRPATDQIHRSIKALNPGDDIQLRHHQDSWRLIDAKGVCVGRLANKFSVPDNTHCTEAKVAAIAIWSKDRSEPQYRENLKCDRWEVVIPELVFSKKIDESD